jgi:hypothetical protein
MRHRFLHNGFACVQRTPAQQVPQRRAQTVDVRPAVGALRIGRLLGRHVVHGPHHLPRAGKLVLLDPGGLQAGQTHVQDLDRPLLVQQQIRRLDIPVDHAALVGVLQPASRLQDAIQHLLQRQRALLFHHGGKIAAFDVLHH